MKIISDRNTLDLTVNFIDGETVKQALDDVIHNLNTMLADYETLQQSITRLNEMKKEFVITVGDAELRGEIEAHDKK